MVVANVSRSDFCIRDLMHSEEPVTLYIVTEPVDKQRLQPLVRVLVNMIVRLSATGLSFEGGMPKPNYRHRLLLMLDEFPSLGKLDILQGIARLFAWVRHQSLSHRSRHQPTVRSLWAR